MSLRWEGPPPEVRANRATYKTKWAAIAATLRQHPGEWAVIEAKATHNAASSTANAIRSGVYRDMTRGEFEAASRAVDGEYRVYARYVGGAS